MPKPPPDHLEMNYRGEGRAGVLIGTVIALALSAIGYLAFTANHSSSSPPDTKLSGEELHVYTDTGTGCQYIGRNTTITPRLNRDGKQICRRPGQ